MRSCSSCRFFAEQSEHDGYCEQHNDLFSIGSCCSRWSSKELEKHELEKIIYALNRLSDAYQTDMAKRKMSEIVEKVQALIDADS